ncbi:IS66-like element accessory protein TnpA [Belnapia moabensis]|uniref:IS66-like element accessory protein TnpA n=1 Tax=Belnapia moabensis TaxID=365533 RepID=UPI00069417F6|nr:transposase [Belnapia moabensis]
MDKTLPPRVTEAEDAPATNRMSVREAPVEVITRGERRRIWTPEQKRDIVMESLEPSGSPIAVARRHGIGSGLLYTWRRQMVEGQLKALLPVPPNFVPVAALPDGRGTVAEASMLQAASSAVLPDDTSARIEIVQLDGVTVWVGAAVEEVALRRVLAALGPR